MQSILGALLTAGYASAVSAAITAAPASVQSRILVWFKFPHRDEEQALLASYRADDESAVAAG